MKKVRKDIAKQHLAGLAIEFIVEGGDPGVLLRETRLKQQYELLRQALSATGWPEAAGRVQAYMEEHDFELSELGYRR